MPPGVPSFVLAPFFLTLRCPQSRAEPIPGVVVSSGPRHGSGIALHQRVAPVGANLVGLHPHFLHGGGKPYWFVPVVAIWWQVIEVRSTAPYIRGTHRNRQWRPKACLKIYPNACLVSLTG